MKAIIRISLLMWIATLSWAQVTTGTFLGTVTDSSGAAVSEVSLRVINVATNQIQSAETNVSGNYSIVQLPAGIYRIEFKRDGFNPEVRMAELRVGDPIRINQTLHVANTATTQQVDSSPGTSLLQTDSAAIGGVVSEFDLLNLPLNGRQYESLVQRFPGAVLPVPGSHLALRGGFNFAGIDEHYNSSLLDGIDNIDPVIRTFSFRPSLDAIQEFQVIERGYNAEFGRNAGGVINIVTKSGTNEFHGSFWEFLRNDNLDARNFFSAAGTAKAPLIRHQFGLTFGGPFKHDKTFFFVEFEGLRQKAGTVRRATVPTLLMRSGDLSVYGVSITDPRNGQVYSNGVIPQSAIDPIANEVLQAYPVPNADGLSANRIETANRIENGGDFSFRVDQVITGSTRLMARSSTSITRVLDPYRTDSG